MVADEFGMAAAAINSVLVDHFDNLNLFTIATRIIYFNFLCLHFKLYMCDGKVCGRAK